jgi:hypothetical protein
MNILELQRLARELQQEVRAKMKACEAGSITTKAFSEFFADASRRDKDISDRIGAYNAAKRLGAVAGVAGGDDDAPPGFGKDSGRRLTFGQKTATELANKIMPDGSLGTKALAPSGSAVTGQEFRPDPVALGRPAYSLLDVLPVVAHDGPGFAYLRQSVRTTNAAVVPDNSVKPTVLVCRYRRAARVPEQRAGLWSADCGGKQGARRRQRHQRYAGASVRDESLGHAA